MKVNIIEKILVGSLLKKVVGCQMTVVSFFLMIKFELSWEYFKRKEF
jgi:hypothetical protein